MFVNLSGLSDKKFLREIKKYNQLPVSFYFLRTRFLVGFPPSNLFYKPFQPDFNAELNASFHVLCFGSGK
jgi:hypothetical protein